MYDIDKNPLRKGNKVQVVKEIKYHSGTTIKVGTIGYVDEFTTEAKPEDKSIQVKSDETKNGFIISGSYLKKIDPSYFEQELAKLLKDLQSQAGYSLRISNFAKRHNIKL